MSCPRWQPSLRRTHAPRPAGAPGVGGPLESDEEEGRDAVRGGGGSRDLRLRDRPGSADRETPGQAGSGAEGTGEPPMRLLHPPLHPLPLILSHRVIVLLEMYIEGIFIFS